jgi:hypothetical protein
VDDTYRNDPVGRVWNNGAAADGVNGDCVFGIMIDFAAVQVVAAVDREDRLGGGCGGCGCGACDVGNREGSYNDDRGSGCRTVIRGGGRAGVKAVVVVEVAGVRLTAVVTAGSTTVVAAVTVVVRGRTAKMVRHTSKG